MEPGHLACPLVALGGAEMERSQNRGEEREGPGAGTRGWRHQAVWRAEMAANREIPMTELSR